MADFVEVLRHIRELAAEGQDLKLAEIFGLPEDEEVELRVAPYTRRWAWPEDLSTDRPRPVYLTPGVSFELNRKREPDLPAITREVVRGGNADPR